MTPSKRMQCFEMESGWTNNQRSSKWNLWLAALSPVITQGQHYWGCSYNIPDSSSAGTQWDAVGEAMAIPSILKSGYSGLEVGGSHKTHLSSLSAGFMLSLGASWLCFPLSVATKQSSSNNCPSLGHIIQLANNLDVKRDMMSTP